MSLLLNQISQNVDELDIKEILDNAPTYSTGISAVYETLWEREIIEKNLTEEKDFLGKIARLRNGFDEELSMLLASHSEQVITHFLKIWQRFFLKENGGWLPFHNSIRQFLIEKTSMDRFGSYRENHHIEYNSSIAEALQSLPIENSMRWELAFHLCESRQYDELLKLISVDSVIAYARQFRLIEDIQEEILLGFRACKRVRGTLEDLDNCSCLILRK